MNDITNEPDQSAQKTASVMYERDVAAQKLGISLEKVEVGYAILKMTVKDWMIQGHNVCHGGFIFSLADTAMAYASNSRNKVNVAMSANIDFLRPAELEETLTAVANEGNQTRNTGMYDVKVYGSSRRLICHFRGRTFNTQSDVV
ncbi:MAG: hydroxyphenylacetyl-CoA thioesterase PaaI [Pseudomonadota bacterium]|nr:hydroxyphenylacetyl-CoA thioesterase PaaI [Pseudomonadota bacterium]